MFGRAVAMPYIILYIKEYKILREASSNTLCEASSVKVLHCLKNNFSFSMLAKDSFAKT